MTTESAPPTPNAVSEPLGRRTVTIGSGAVEGVVEDGITRFLGVPYAAAPFGANRFRLPQPVEPWEGVRDASAFGPTAPQAPYGGGLADLLPTVEIPGEDILNVNVWTPALASAPASTSAPAPSDPSAPTELLPVMVWIHGGSLAHGSNALSSYDGTAFARDGVVFVSANYRLGSEGFSVLDDAPQNLGLADLHAALRWVQGEIEHFGGDPKRVTIFGQSAGGALVAAIAAHPDSGSLIQRAIIMSGPLSAQTPETAGRITQLMAKDLGVPATRAGFGSVSPADLVAAQERVTAGTTPITGGAAFTLVRGSNLVPVDPIDAFTNGRGADIPILIGTTTEEYRLWFMPTGVVGTITKVHVLLARLKFKISAAAVRLYGRNRPGATPGEILGALATDLLLRVPANRIADARASFGSSTWLYEFDWSSPVQDLGAAHAMELGFVFDVASSPDAIALTGPDAPQSLATSMHSAWVAFARDGEPGWPVWNPERPVRSFDGAADPLIHAPRDAELQSFRP
jgi:para-nitrobenzyl esterase